MGGQSSAEEKCLFWSLIFQQRGFGCSVRVCIPEQMLEMVTSDTSLCVGGQLWPHRREGQRGGGELVTRCPGHSLRVI